MRVLEMAELPFTADLTHVHTVTDDRLQYLIGLGSALAFAILAYALIIWEFAARGFNPFTVGVSAFIGAFGTLSLFLALELITGLPKPLRLTATTDQLSITLSNGRTRVYRWADPRMHFQIIQMVDFAGEGDAGAVLMAPRRAGVDLTLEVANRTIETARALGSEVSLRRKRIRYMGVRPVYTIRGRRPPLST